MSKYDVSDSQPVMDLFDAGTTTTTVTQAVKTATAAAAAGSPLPTTMRMEFYDNGPKPGRGRTQYGLVLDCFDSEQRYNINYGVKGNDANTLYAYQNGPKATLDEYNNLKAMTDFWIANGFGTNPNAMMAVGKKNNLAGTGDYDFRAGDKDLFYELGAIIVINGTDAPDVYLFVNTLDFPLTKGWVATPRSSHASKKYEVKF